MGIVVLAVALLPAPSSAQQRSDVQPRGDSVWMRLVDVEVRAAVQALAPYLDRPVVFSNGITSARLSFETPQPVPRTEVVRLLGGLLGSQGLELQVDSAAGIYRVASRAPAPAPAVPEPARRAASSGPELFVIRLRHAKAAEVAATVNALYGRAAAVGEIGERPATLPDELRQTRIPPPGQSAAPGPRPVFPTGGAGRGAALAGETVIVPDAASNSLLVRASRGDYELILAAVREVDVRPLQVLIQVIIAEVQRDRTFAFGVDAKVPRSRVPGFDDVTASAEQKGTGVGDLVLRVMREGPGLDIDATLRAAAARGEARILSRPVLLAANNEAAEILVGSERPFVQVARTLPTDGATRDQVVQYRNVGTHLSVRPTISADGYVALDVSQEVNAATAEVQFDAPVIATRTLQTKLLVRDGQTIVLGGLADRQREANQGGVPLLSSIPLLGGLFGRASRRTTETEFFLFLTPRILRTDEDAAAATEPYGQQADVSLPARDSAARSTSGPESTPTHGGPTGQTGTASPFSPHRRP